MKISQSFSTLLSQIATGIAGIGVAVLAFLLPRIVRFYGGLHPEASYGLSLALLYAILLCGAAAVVALWVLLACVRSGRVFTQIPVLCLRVLSWSCVMAGVFFVLLGFYYYFSFLVGAAALFLGLILRVVKNCLAEAVTLKEENDFTI